MSEQKIVADVFNKDGTLYDQCYTWETGQTMAAEGRKVVATADDGHISKEEAQKIYDTELEWHNDCFGVE